MKIKFNKTTQEEQDIVLPAFVKFGEHYTKIINEQTVLIVDNWSFNNGIRYEALEHCAPFGNDGWQFITEDQFNEVLLKVYDNLCKFIPLVTA